MRGGKNDIQEHPRMISSLLAPIFCVLAFQHFWPIFWLLLLKLFKSAWNWIWDYFWCHEYFHLHWECDLNIFFLTTLYTEHLWAPLTFFLSWAMNWALSGTFCWAQNWAQRSIKTWKCLNFWVTLCVKFIDFCFWTRAIGCFSLKVSLNYQTFISAFGNSIFRQLNSTRK